MANESLTFDIVAKDSASRSFDSAGRAALDMGAKMDVAAKNAAVLDEALKRQQAAARSSVEATLTAAKADKILADAEHVLSDRALEADFALRKQADAAKKAGDASAKASTGVGALAGGGGIPGGGMGALIAAGVALSPIIATVGTGLAGFGLAAYGAVKPIENAAQKTGGLRANMGLLDAEQRKVAAGLLGLGSQYHQFEHQLQPEVLGVFNSGLHLAGNLLHDVEPVAKATGTALGGLLGQIDREFQSGTWQSFFGWMGRQAGPDLQLVGGAFVHLLDVIPPLMQTLNPLAVGFVRVVDDAAQAAAKVAILTHDVEQLGIAAVNLGRHGSGNSSPFAFLDNAHLIHDVKFANDILPRFFQHAAEGAAGTKLPMDAFFQNTQRAGKATQGLSVQQRAEAAQAAAQTAAINKLNAAMTLNIAKVLTLEGDQVSWKQAQQAATQAVNQNHKALDGNSSSALAARAAIIAATTSTIKFADDSDTTTGALHRASGAIQDQIRWLEQHAGKSKIARDEIHALRMEEAKIRREIDQKIVMQGSGRYSISPSTGFSNPTNNPIGKLAGGAAGMLIRAGTTPTADDVLIRASRGELVVPTHMVAAGAVDHLRGRIPGFAAGGLAGSYSGTIPGLTRFTAGMDEAFRTAMLSSMVGTMQHAVQSAMSSWGAAGPGGGAPSANAALARRMFPAENFAAWNYVAMRESGWNQFARNPSSGAYGIPQALPESKLPFAGQAAGGSNPAAQISWMEGYMRARYGGAAGAAAHEAAFNWYGNGFHGWFDKPTVIGVGERGRERVDIGGGGTVININVSVPPTVNPRDAGRQFADVLKAYIKAGGTLYPAGVTPR